MALATVVMLGLIAPFAITLEVAFQALGIV
jgi:hypothetical protein